MIDFIAHHAPVIGLIFFFTFFTATLIWVFRPGSKADYMAKACIPLKKDALND